MDIKAVVGTSMDPYISALCMAQHLFLAGRAEDDVKVIVGKDIHDAPFRAGIWIPEDLVGFPLREKCLYANDTDLEEGIMSVELGDMTDLANMLVDSERHDWVYISLGGLTSVSALTKEFPDAAKKIEDMVVMASAICKCIMICFEVE